MFSEILVAVDGSKIGKRALEVAIEEARLWKARVHVIYVVETGLFSSLPMDSTWEIMYSMLEKEGQETLSLAKEQAAAKGVRLETYIRQGHAGNEIIKASQELGADLIVVGSHGKSEVDRLLLGSVSSFVVGNSSVAVLVVRPSRT
ncbi:MAG: Universal stress protein [Methanoregulaceae archaeon PtaU1.Bin059]|nr:MAG: Universal stress protein [Methanoregulaceae archaeon PtaB.Bin152]OPY40929.1 MAG: Universal stress protein [Methanoregulaceae archaeon PtaU1.Bin059]